MIRDRIAAQWRDTPAMLTIVAITCTVSLLLMLFAIVGEAVIGGGFIPAMVGAHGATPPGAPLMLPVWLTPLSATLVHAGIVHLGFNQLILVVCGDELERTLGWRGTAALYLIGAYAAAAGYWLQDPSSPWPLIGANGAVSAMLGAYALLFGRRRARALGPIPARLVAILWLGAAWIGIQLLIGLADHAVGAAVTIGALIAGFVAGLALAQPILLWHYRGA
ncbi:rhomboid family intramembrane serine protease [Sphingomonas sp. RT2P30]|uniref:rhomboid family intramembrane serine protease n=1 Tax=Parasphingomonas halimpatiens TaxID=3096162 RepID=UPI002FC70F86